MSMHEGRLKGGGATKTINSLSSKVRKSWRDPFDDVYEAKRVYRIYEWCTRLCPITDMCYHAMLSGPISISLDLIRCQFPPPSQPHLNLPDGSTESSSAADEAEMDVVNSVNQANSPARLESGSV